MIARGIIYHDDFVRNAVQRALQASQRMRGKLRRTVIHQDHRYQQRIAHTTKYGILPHRTNWC